MFQNNVNNFNFLYFIHKSQDSLSSGYNVLLFLYNVTLYICDNSYCKAKSQMFSVSTFCYSTYANSIQTGF